MRIFSLTNQLFIFSVFFLHSHFNNGYSRGLSPNTSQSNPQDSTLVFQLFSKSDSLSAISLFDQSYEYAKKALELSQKTGFHYGIARSYLKLARPYIARSDYQKGIEYSKLALEEAKSHNIPEIIFMSYGNLGFAYSRMNLDSSFYYARKATMMPAKYRNEAFNFKLNILFSDLYASIGRFTESTGYLTELIDQIKESENQAGLSDLLVRYALIAIRQNDYHTAMTYLNEALEKCSEPYLIKVIEANKILVLIRLERYDEAQALQKTLVEYSKANNQNDLYLTALFDAYYIHIKDNQLDSAKLALETIRKELLKYPNINEVGKFFGDAFVYHLKKNDYGKALMYLDSAVCNLKKLNNPENIIELYNAAAIDFEEAKDYRLAAKYYKLLDQVKDSFRTSQNEKAYSLLKIEYDIDKKDNEIKYLSNQSNLQKETIHKNRIIYLTVILLLASLVTLSVLIIYHVIRKKRMVELLLKKNEEIADHKYQSLYKDSQLQAIREKISGQEEERARIARELHDGIASTVAALHLYFENEGESLSPDQSNNLRIKLRNLLEEIRTISHNLLPPQFTDVNISHILPSYIQDLNKNRCLHYTLQVTPESNWETVSTDIQVEIYRIVQEICSNIQKHSVAKRVEIILIQHENRIDLIIEDDGDPFDYKKNGIGYHNIQQRVTCLGGLFEKSDVSFHGNNYLVQIPLN